MLTYFLFPVDLPSMTFPVTYADKILDLKRSDEWEPSSKRDEMIQADYDAGFYHNSPVSLQLLGKRLEEEKVVEMVEVISKLVDFKHRA
jgi:amidase